MMDAILLSSVMVVSPRWHAASPACKDIHQGLQGNYATLVPAVDIIELGQKPDLALRGSIYICRPRLENR
jgi:hypothetical protein